MIPASACGIPPPRIGAGRALRLPGACGMTPPVMHRSLRPQTIRRELGMALSMLALWLLTLLAPLHLTSGLLRDMAAAGHVLPAGWSVCVTLADGDTDGTDHATIVCPAHAMAQNGAAPPDPPFLLADFQAALLAVVQPAPRYLPVPEAPRPPGQPRAPPALI